MARILVVGGAGYIGSHVVQALLAAGYKVVVFDNLSTGQRCNLLKGSIFRHGDLLRPASIAEVCREFRFQGVIHLAALKAAGESMLRPEVYARHNITGSLNLLAAATQFGVERFVFSSSAAVYGDPERLPIDEQHATRPVNFYGFTKLTVEQNLAWFARLRGLHIANLRYFNAVGYDPGGALRGLEKRPANLLPVCMEVARGWRERLEIFGDDWPTPDGTCIRDYVHVTDLAAAHVRALEVLGTRETLTLNLGSEVGYSVLEVVQAVERAIGRELPRSNVARRSGDSAELVASAELAREVLDWQPQHSSLETIVSSTWNVYRDAP